MSDSVTQGQLMKFLLRYHFSPKGKRNVIYIGIFNGVPRVVTFHYHKDSDAIPAGTLSAIARQLGLSKKELVDKAKDR